MKARILGIVSTGALLAFSSVVQSDIITQWNFEADTLDASSGSGAAANVGGTSSGFAAGNGGGRGWSTSAYQAQGTGSGAAGVSFFTSTEGFTTITLGFDHRSSGTGSRWSQVDYSLDGGANWVSGFWNNTGGLSPHDTFYSFNVDFSSVSGANDNPDFGVRIVSIFSPLAFDQNASLADFAANTAYMRANAQASYDAGGGTGTGDYGMGGTWRFDNVTFNGTVVPEPSAVLLMLASGMLLAARRRLSFI
jgi:hypothetical protein